MLPAIAARFPLTSMIAAMIVWAVYFVAVYASVGLHCERPQALGAGPLQWLLGLSTLAALGVALLLGAAALLAWKRCDGHAGAANGRLRFMAAVSGLLALIAVLAILMTALPILLLAPCPGWGTPS